MGDPYKAIMYLRKAWKKKKKIQIDWPWMRFERETYPSFCFDIRSSELLMRTDIKREKKGTCVTKNLSYLTMKNTKNIYFKNFDIQ